MTSFSISEFASSIDSLGGISESSIFQVKFTPPPSMTRPLDNASFLAFSANLPGIHLVTRDIQRYGYGLMDKVPFNADFNSCDITFFADNHNFMHDYFDDWTRSIFEYVSHGTPNKKPSSHGAFTERLPYLMGYKSEYSSPLQIIQYNRTTTKIKTTQLNYAYPSDVGDLQFSWVNSNRYQTFPVRFSFYDVEWVENDLNDLNSELLRNIGELTGGKTKTKLNNLSTRL